ncbi:MAG: hypothetical protein V5A34_03800 [Halapricum sp.]
MTEPDDPDNEPAISSEDLEPNNEPAISSEDLEPEEFEPDSLGPEIPTPPASPSDADSEVRGLFWVLVLVANVALLTASLGIMFIVFQDRWALGTQLTLAGVILGLYVYYRVYRFHSE